MMLNVSAMNTMPARPPLPSREPVRLARPDGRAISYMPSRLRAKKTNTTVKNRLVIQCWLMTCSTCTRAMPPTVSTATMVGAVHPGHRQRPIMAALALLEEEADRHGDHRKDARRQQRDEPAQDRRDDGGPQAGILGSVAGPALQMTGCPRPECLATRRIPGRARLEPLAAYALEPQAVVVLLQQLLDIGRQRHGFLGRDVDGHGERVVLEHAGILANLQPHGDFQVHGLAGGRVGADEHFQGPEERPSVFVDVSLLSLIVDPFRLALRRRPEVGEILGLLERAPCSVVPDFACRCA